MNNRGDAHGLPFPSSIITSVATDPMTYPTPDANGTITWSEAVQFAWNPDQDLNFLVQFAQDYGHMMGERIDLGELEVWYSDLAINAIADLVFS